MIVQDGLLMVNWGRSVPQGGARIFVRDLSHTTDLDEESPSTGKRRPGAHSLRHSAARHWLMVGEVLLNVVSAWLGHANV